MTASVRFTLNAAPAATGAAGGTPSWYVARGGQKAGPFAWGHLQAWAARGDLLPGDMLWRRGMPRWVPAGSLAGRQEPPTTAARRRWPLRAAALAFVLAFGAGAVLTYGGRTEAQSARDANPAAAPAAPADRAAPRVVPAAQAADYPPEERPAVADTLKKAPPKAQAAAAPTLPPGVRLDAPALARFIDQSVQARLDAAGVKASPLSDDAEFLRRAYLDLTGAIPTPEKVVAFLGSPDPDKRAHLIDELLADPRYGAFQAEIWTAAMVPADSNNRRLKAGPLRAWLAAAFNQNRPWNETVSDLLTATGSQDQNGAVTLFVANPTPDKVTDTVGRLFLGVQLQCAQCHNHPFTNMKRKEYAGMAAFFTKVRQNAGVRKAAKKGVAPAISESAEPKGKGRKAKAQGAIATAAPRFLHGEEPRLRPGEPYRPVFARWLTAPENPFFARAIVNKTWAHFFGRGFVNPVDDMIEEHAASHPALLAALAEQFKAGGFDVKHLVRAVCNSQTYQRTSRPAAGNGKDAELYSHAAVRVLSPGQLYDALAAVLGGPQQGRVKGKLAGVNKRGPVTARDQFLAFFHVGDGANPLEYQAGIPQALRLMNAQQVGGSAAVISRAVQVAGNDPGAVVEQLYLAALARRPTDEERQRLTEYVGRQRDARTGYGDVLWALVNSSEFSVNH
jgi:hypothetical protein